MRKTYTILFKVIMINASFKLALALSIDVYSV